MKIRVIWTGKTRNPHLSAVSAQYVERVRHFVGLEILELKEPRTRDDRTRVAAESEKILRRIAPTDHVVALDGAGRSRSSRELARLIGGLMGDGRRDLVFVVGGPSGLSDAIRERADDQLSLSDMTLSHDLARTLLLEQLYRALTIIRNLPYAR